MEISNKNFVPIKKWMYGETPREKLITNGLSSLSNSELLSILINAGSRERNATELAKDILKLADDNLRELGKLSVSDLQKIKGIGEAKSTLISAAIELGRRREIALPLDKVIIRSSHDIAHYLRLQLRDLHYEAFAIICLNRANRVNHFQIVSRGGITGTVADPRVIMKIAVEKNATSLIISHNHPSGNLKPSAQDEHITKMIREAGSYFDIKLLDSIIVSDDGYYSFADEGIL